MPNVKGHGLRVDWVNTPKVRELDSQIKSYANPYNLGDFISDDDIPNIRAVNALISGATPPAPPLVIKNIAPGAADVYTLSAGELADVNSIGRWPNFVATIAGVEFKDIIPTYNGIVGGFTSVTVQLHGNGSGVNIDDTIFQFS